MSQQINLYDPVLRPKRELLTAARLAAVAVGLILVVGAWGAWLRIDLARVEAAATAAAQQLKQAQDQLAAVGAELSGRKPDPRLEQELAGLRSLLDMRGEMAEVLRKGMGSETTGFSEYLRGLARQASEGLWLTGFQVSDGGSVMEIQGRTLDPALLPDYVRRLNGEKAFQGRAFAALRMDAALPPPVAPAAGAATATAPAAGTSPRFHEFVLVPDKDPKAAAAKGASS